MTSGAAFDLSRARGRLAPRCDHQRRKWPPSVLSDPLGTTDEMDRFKGGPQKTISAVLLNGKAGVQSRGTEIRGWGLAGLLADNAAGASKSPPEPDRVLELDAVRPLSRPGSDGRYY